MESNRCNHTPACPSAGSEDRAAAQVVASHPEQGWSLLCNGVLEFDDLGEILPDGYAIAPRRDERASMRAGITFLERRSASHDTAA
jgi:hypothetical protein